MSSSSTTESCISERLRQVRKGLGLTQSDMAEKVGKSQQSWANYESGRNEPPFKVLQDLIVESDVNPDWLMTGTGEKGDIVKRDDILDRCIQVPMLGTYFGAGAGGGDDEGLTGLLLAGDYLRDWMRQEAGVDPQKAFLGEVRGRSMEDWAHDGDLVIGERVEAITYEDIYAVDLDGELLIKHCIRRPDAVILRSENRMYDDIEVTASDAFRVIGRVARRIVA